jgi:hypothetical protein
MSETYNPHLKALLIGINYHNKPQLRLQGCTNDITVAREYLANNLQVDPNHITTLVDPPLSWEGGKEWGSFPTKDNIVQAVSRFLASGVQGDVLFLHYSGHGTQVREQDGRVSGEALVPLDAEDTGSNFSNVLRDFELEKLIAEKTPPNVTLYIVLDCCYGGGDIDKQGARNTVFPYNKSIGTQVRAAIPRNLPLRREGETPSGGYEYPTMESRLRAVASAKPNVIVFVGGSKFEPVVEATFNFTSFGAFSYFFYQTLKQNRYLRNINLLNSVRTNIKSASFFQQPQLIVARDEMCTWNFLSPVTGEENPNIILPSFASANRMDAKQVQEWQLIDAIATLEVNHELGMHRKRAGKWVPFVVEDIARIIAGVAGRAVLKIAQQEGIRDNAAFALALIAIKDSIYRVSDILLPPPIPTGTAKRPIAYPTMQDLISGVVLPSVRNTIGPQLPPNKVVDIEAALHRDGFIPNTNAALSQHVGRAIQLAEEIRDVTVAMPEVESRSEIDHALELAKQVIITISASEIYAAFLSSPPSAPLPPSANLPLSASLPPDVTPLANDISNRIGQAFNNDFISRLTSSSDPQGKVEKLCLVVLQGMVRDYKVPVLPQDLADRVAELTSRFSCFVHLSAPAGQALLRARRKGMQTAAISLVETLVGPICACAVDDAVFERAQRQGAPPPSLLSPSPYTVSDLVKMAAHSVAELAIHAALDALKLRNVQNISAGPLCGVLRTLAKGAAVKVLDTLSKVQSEENGTWGGKGDTWNSHFYEAFPVFVSIAVDTAIAGLNALSVRYPATAGTCTTTTAMIQGEDAEQLIANYVHASVPWYLRFLPFLGTAIPLVNSGIQALGSPQGKRAEVWEMSHYGAEVLATSFASIITSRDASVELSVAMSIVKEAVGVLALKIHENSLVANVTESLSNTLKRRNGLSVGLKRITHSALQEEVSRTAHLFAAFSPPTSVPSHTLFDVSAVFAGTGSRAAQQCVQLPTGAQGELRANPPFFVNFGRMIAQVAAGALLDVLQKQGILSDTPRVRHLSKRIKNSATNIAVQLLSETLAITPTATTPTPTPTATTMLEQVLESMIPAVAKAARAIIGNETPELSLMSVATHAVATRMRFMGNLLPILSTVSPPLLNNVTGLISTSLAQRGKEEGPTFESDVERAGLTTMIALGENRDILQYKSGNVTDDIITQAVARAIQYTRENPRGPVEQAVKRSIDSFEFKGEGMRYLFEESLRPIALQASQVAQRIPETPAEGLPYGAPKTVPQISPTYLSAGDVDRITQHVLSLYSFAPGFSDRALRPTVAQTVAYVAHYNPLAHYPRNYVLELAKMAGCVAAKEQLRPGTTDSKNAITLGLAVVAQLLIPPAQIVQGVLLKQSP